MKSSRMKKILAVILCLTLGLSTNMMTMAESTNSPAVQTVQEEQQTGAAVTTDGVEVLAETDQTVTETPTPTATPEPETTPQVTATPTPETTPEATETPTPETTPEATETPTPETTPEATATPTETPVITEPTQVPEVTVTPTPETEETIQTNEGVTEIPSSESPDTGEEVFSKSYNDMSVEELYNVLMEANDTEYFSIYNKLTEEKRKEIDEYIFSQTQIEEVNEDSAKTYLNAAEAQILLQQVMRQATAKSIAANNVNSETNGFNTETGVEPEDGLEIKKELTEYDSTTGKGELALEAYVTGNVGTDKHIPVDIVLVLDQSGSMEYGFGYRWSRVLEYTNESAFDRQSSYFYKVGEEYFPVIIERNKTAESYSEYSKNNRRYSDLVNAEDIYVEIEGQKYQLEVRSEYSNWYEFYYIDSNGEQQQIDTDWSNRWLNDQNSKLRDYTLYRKNTTYEYIYYYKNTDGNNEHIGASEGANSRPGYELYYQESYNGNSEVPYENSRLKALKDGVTTFVNAVRQDAEEYNVDHKIAIVGFGSVPDDGYWGNDGYGNNTEVLTVAGDNSSYGKGSVGQKYNDMNNSDYSQALVSNKSLMIDNAINALAASGATSTDYGMEMAKKVIENRRETTAEIEGTEYQRPTVVIMFTDGEPTHGSSFDDDVASDTINEAKTIKDGGTTVYTVGIFNGADASITDPNNMDDSNRFMQAVSSNYPNAAGDGWYSFWDQNMGTRNPALGDTSYYLSASDTEALNAAFSAIAEGIGSPKVQLDESTIMYDVISEYFKFDEDALNEAGTIGGIKYEVWKTTDGGTNWSLDTEDESAITIQSDGSNIQVSGFDYSENYVTADHPGKKLVIKIPIVYDGKNSFGGNNIPTNEATSGIYNNGECFGNFEIPKVNHPIDYQMGCKDQTIYLTNQPELEQLIEYIGKYKANGINNAFVDITYTLKLGDIPVGTLFIEHGKTVQEAQWTEQPINSDISNCTTYALSCSVSPWNNGVSEEEISQNKGEKAVTTEIKGSGGEATLSPSVHVLVPQITGHDKFIFLGDKADFSGTSTKDSWIDKNAHSSIPDVSGTEPVLTITPVFVNGTQMEDIDNYYPTEDSNFNFTVKVGEEDITDSCVVSGDITTAHDEEGCIVDGETDLPEHFFTIHVIAGSINITKIIDGKINRNLEGNPIFTFKIEYFSPDSSLTGDAEEIYYRTIEFEDDTKEKDAESLSGLRKGIYRISELKTQKFQNTNVAGKGCNADSDSTNKTVTFYIGMKDKENPETDTNQKQGTATFTNQKTGPSTNTDTDVVVNRFVYDETTGKWTIKQIWNPGKGQEELTPEATGNDSQSTTGN